jgi:hypothetical protein
VDLIFHERLEEQPADEIQKGLLRTEQPVEVEEFSWFLPKMK